MKWLTRDEWRDRFAEVYDAHLQPACKRSGVDFDEVVSILGEDFFMTAVWGSAFEDFLTRDFDGGRNIVEDYLKRRGWKESASTRAYMTRYEPLSQAFMRSATSSETRRSERVILCAVATQF